MLIFATIAILIYVGIVAVMVCVCLAAAQGDADMEVDRRAATELTKRLGVVPFAPQSLTREGEQTAHLPRALSM